MKSLARMHAHQLVAQDRRAIEELARRCSSYQDEQQGSNQIYSSPWKLPDKPFQRMHVDFAGPFLDKTFFLIVDTYSKWLEVIPTFRVTTVQTNRRMVSYLEGQGLWTTKYK